MVNYRCERCHKDFNHFSNFVKHLQNKTPCGTLYSMKRREEIYHEVVEKKLNERQIQCPHCEERFTHKSSLYRHQKQFHNSTVDPILNGNGQNNITTAHNLTEAQVNDSQTISSSLTHSHNQNTENSYNNINVTININPFGQERLDHILSDKDFLTNCLKDRLHNSIPEMFSKIYLNDDVPENKNIKYQRERHPRLVKVLKSDDEGEKKWFIETANPIIDTIIEKCVDILIRHNEEIRTPLVVPRTAQEHDTRDTECDRECNLVKTKAKTRGHHAPTRDKIFENLKCETV